MFVGLLDTYIRFYLVDWISVTTRLYYNKEMNDICPPLGHPQALNFEGEPKKD